MRVAAAVLVVRSRARRRDMSLQALCQREPSGRTSIAEADQRDQDKAIGTTKAILEVRGVALGMRS